MFVRVTGEDWTRLADRADELAQFIGHRAFMRMTGGHCVALDVRLNQDGGPDYFCTLYEQRPQICRDLARGSAECEAELELKRMPRRMG
jgi:hypothetical protein